MNFSALDQFLRKLPETFGVPGLQCRVYHQHKQVYTCDVGVRDCFTGEPIHGDEQYFGYSITKPITATAAMQLFERGILAPNDLLSDYIPEFRQMRCIGDNGGNNFARTPITLRHLLTMTSGLVYDIHTPIIEKYISDNYETAGTVDVVRKMATSPLYFEPGTHWHYSEGHDIMAAVIELATKMPYEEYIRQNIFEPLGMTSSCFREEEADPARLTFCYNSRNGVLSKTPEFIFRLTKNYVSGGASLIPSADDYIKFSDALSCGGIGPNGNRILLPCSIELMRQNQLTKEMRRDIPWRHWVGYGYGVRTLVDRAEAGSLGPVGEFGWDGLKGAFQLADPENEISLFYIEQTGRYKESLLPRMRNIFYACLQS